MLSDNPWFCEDDQKWLTLEESIIHAAEGHQISEIQNPTKVEVAA
jgi:hypothetical protein